ncbi:MAG: hypothetical protein JSU63_11600, partial [Phycisphaerales bacterium]
VRLAEGRPNNGSCPQWGLFRPLGEKLLRWRKRPAIEPIGWCRHAASGELRFTMWLSRSLRVWPAGWKPCAQYRKRIAKGKITN